MLFIEVLCSLALVAGIGIPFTEAIDFRRLKKLIYWTHGDIYKFREQTLDGEYVEMSKYKGQLLIFINLPFECDYERIQVLNEILLEYYDKGLRIIAFPYDKLNKEIPLNRFISLNIISEHIQACQWHFDVFRPVEINGYYTDKLWEFLKISVYMANQDITEDHSMFMIDRNGEPIKFILGGQPLTFESLENELKPYL